MLPEVVIEPLCGWLLSLGHVFFEAHKTFQKRFMGT